MVNIVAIVIGLALYVAVSFGIKSFVLSQEADVMSILVELFAVLITLWVVKFASGKIGVNAKVPLTS